MCVSFHLQTDPSSGGGVLARRAPPALLQIVQSSKVLFQGVLTPRGKVDETEDEGGEKREFKKKGS